MNRSTVISLIVVIVSGGFLFFRAQSTEMGKVYTRDVPAEAEGANWTNIEEVNPGRETADGELGRDSEGVTLNMNRTVGLWISAILTLCIMSFLVGDSVIYKLAEAVFLGVSAAYAMVVGFWGGIVPNLLGNVVPGTMRDSLIPGLQEGKQPDWMFAIALVLSVMMLMRLSPKGNWIARWPLAFFIGVTAGMKLIHVFEADFVRQISSTLLSFTGTDDGSINWGIAIKNITIVVGVLSTLVYFFFSFEHKGVVGGTARLGIWFLMITFGAGFAFTVMGRIALISERLKFLFDDWLWIIDPLSRRMGL